MINARSGFMSRHRVWLTVAALALFAPAGAESQLYHFGESGEPGAVVARSGPAVVIESHGPALFGQREFYRPVPPLRLRNRWVTVQDSTFGLVFSEPSGVKPELDGFEADVFLHALEGVRAVEIRSLLFNVWGELSGYLGVTVLAEYGPGESWDVHPRWRDVDEPTHGHRTSITWINRVMFEDESVLEADVEPVGLAWTFVTGEDFHGLPEERLVRANGP